MTASPGEVDVLRDLRDRVGREGHVFWYQDGELGIFEPELARRVNGENFARLVLPDRLRDLLRRRRGEPFPWKRVRTAWLPRVTRLTEPDALARLEERMADLLAAHVGRDEDLVPVAHEVISRSLVPSILDGLSARDTERVAADQQAKIDHLVTLEMDTAPRPGLWDRLRDVLVQVAAGSVVRRELRGRARGRRPRRLDLADPIVDLLPALGLDRAVDAVTGLLTAIAGPPGAAGSALVYQLGRSPEWTERLAAEHASVSSDQLRRTPTKAAPLTHRFVLEALRRWAPTPIVDRAVHTEIECAGHRLGAGHGYLLSPDLQHHDPRFWQEPERFDPDRWRAGSPAGPRCPAAYVPFGYAPRSCVGASLGVAQLVLFARLLVTRFRVQLTDPEGARMALVSVHLPRNLHGRVLETKGGETR